jgi:hypothetical protein
MLHERRCNGSNLDKASNLLVDAAGPFNSKTPFITDVFYPGTIVHLNHRISGSIVLISLGVLYLVQS